MGSGLRFATRPSCGVSSPLARGVPRNGGRCSQKLFQSVLSLSDTPACGHPSSQRGTFSRPVAVHNSPQAEGWIATSGSKTGRVEFFPCQSFIIVNNPDYPPHPAGPSPPREGNFPQVANRIDIGLITECPSGEGMTLLTWGRRRRG